MSETLPRLRMNLDFMPSPVPDRPGLLIRDPYHYSDATLILPPGLVECLALFDGENSRLDLRQYLVRLTGELQVSDLEKHLVETLDQAGFLENESYFEMKADREREFAEASVREPAHAGSGYPDQLHPLRSTLERWMDGDTPRKPDARSLIGIAAPHVSPEGGWQSYREAYRALQPEHAERTFVILGTSHYGQPSRFGLTRKAFLTPVGASVSETRLVNELEKAAPNAVVMEDYCHAVEHSIEFQVLFLQHLFGPGIRVVPILCGSYAESIYRGGRPEDDDDVRAFLDTLGEIAAREGSRLLWVLGIDMAHMGRRYGDRFEAIADRGAMLDVTERDRKRIERMNEGDEHGFWELVQQNQDDLKWCGSAPVYTFLKAVPEARGTLRRYEQWNIDEQSVVSFGAVEFSPKAQ